MEDIELRSEQVRKIIGQIPPVLIRSGISIMGVIIALLLVAAAFIPYPETIASDIRLSSVQEGHAFATGKLPYAYISRVKKGMKVIIELEGYASDDYRYQQGHIETVRPTIITMDEQNYFDITLVIKSFPFMQKGMKGRATILLSNETLLNRILN